MSYPYIILYATRAEARSVLDLVEIERDTMLCGRRRVMGKLFGKSVRMVETGIGLVNTAQALTDSLAHEAARLVVQIGIAGAFPSARLQVGSVALATTEIDGETGLRYSNRWESAEAIGLPIVPGSPNIYNRYELNKDLVRRAANCCDGATGTFVTVAGVTADPEAASQIEKRFSPICESMEGSAAAQVCCVYSTPFLEVRGVSNVVGVRDKSTWDIPGAARAAQDALGAIFPQIEDILDGSTIT